MARSTRSDPASTLLSLFVVVVVLGGAVYAAGFALDGSGTRVETVENEPHNVTYSNPVTVDHGPASASGDGIDYLANETVVNSNGDQLTEGVDYHWNTSTGEIDLEDTSATTDGETFQISYAYNVRLSIVQDVLRPISSLSLGTILPILVLVVVGIGVVAFAAYLFRQGGSR